jgi:GntR family transcriptional regulator
MLYELHPDAPVPIYEQIVDQIIYGIAAGDLEPGTPLLSVRDLAQKLLVNPNTVAHAYQELERGGLVATRRGRCMEVTAEAPAACRARRQEIVRRRIRQALHEAAASALPPDAIRKLVEEELARANGRHASREKT